MGSVRIQGRDGLADVVRWEGEAAAQIHGQQPPADGEGAGDRIVTNVPVPSYGVIVSDGVIRGTLFVQGIHWRSRSWAYSRHRVVELRADRFSEVLAASPWAAGAWSGDSVLSREFQPGLPSEANPT